MLRQNSSTSSSRRYLIGLGGTVVLLVTAYVLLAEWLYREVVWPTFGSQVIWKLYDTDDAVFGDSHFQDGLAALVGFNNLAAPGNSLLETKLKILRYYEHKKGFRVIIDMCTARFANSPDFVRDAYEPFRKDKPTVFMFRTVFIQQALYYIYHNFILPLRILATYHRFSPDLLLSDGRPVWETHLLDEPEEVRQRWVDSAAEAPSPDVTVTPHFAIFRDILDFLRGRDAKVCLVTPPVMTTLRSNAIGSATYQAAFADFAKLANAYGAHYVNFYLRDYPDHLFRDSTHLNRAGSMRFSDEIVRLCFGS